jgi:hypothetical protein
MQMKYFLHVFVMGMLFSLHAFSQGAIISYNNAPLPEICNTFNGASGPFKLGGCEHYPYSGGVVYNHTDGGIALKAQSGNSTATNLGTAYAIKYAFKEGYRYSIEVAAWQIDPSQGDNQLTLSLIDQLPDPSQSDPVSCGPVDQNHWAPLMSTPLVSTGLTTNRSSQTLISFTASQANNYLAVLMWQGAAAGSYGFISGIVIHETPPTYTLAPASINKSCGTPISQTFSITDVNNSGKVSSYVWNLGSANNGWVYNGAAAPQTITTTTPTLDLTADGCITPSNVTATVTRPGGTYATNPSVVTFSLPVTYNGPSQICDVANYSIDGLPCGATVAWSLSPAGNGTLSANTGSTTTLTRTGNDRNFNLTATITSPCGNVTLGKVIQVVGQPEPFLITSPADIPCQSGKVVPSVSFTASPATLHTTYIWSWEGTSGLGTLTSHTSSASGKFSTGSYTVTATAFNACGITEGPTFQFNIVPCQFLAAERDNIAVSPNPASHIITVTTTAATKEALTIQVTTDIREIRIIDKTGVLLRKQSFPAGTTTATIHVESFKPDIYILLIGDGKTFKTRKITISR